VVEVQSGQFHVVCRTAAAAAAAVNSSRNKWILACGSMISRRARQQQHQHDDLSSSREADGSSSSPVRIAHPSTLAVVGDGDTLNVGFTSMYVINNRSGGGGGGGTVQELVPDPTISVKNHSRDVPVLKPYNVVQVDEGWQHHAAIVITQQ
jgi:hypothetical protein